MLKSLPVNISQKIYPLFLFYSQINTYYSHSVLLLYYFKCMVNSINVSDTSKVVNESHPYLL